MLTWGLPDKPPRDDGGIAALRYFADRLKLCLARLASSRLSRSGIAANTDRLTRSLVTIRDSFAIRKATN